VFEIREAKDDGTSIVNAAAWMEARAGQELSPGVYAIYDAAAALQFVGYTRDVQGAFEAHRASVGGERSAKVRVAVFANKSMATRVNLRAEADRWIEEWVQANGGEGSAIPPGNTAMGAALGWKLAPEVWEEDNVKPAAAAAAVKAPAAAAAAGAGAEGVGIISPFDATAAAAAGDTSTAAPADDAPLDPDRPLLELTMENVDAALEEVRPYLIADGGNVEVVGIEDGIVAVRMNGACGTCTSSNATLKMGIEKTLIKVFGRDAVKEVVNLDSLEPGGAMSLSIEKVEAHLEKLRGAIHNYGGSVQVLEVKDGICSLEFSGPQALAMSIASSVKGKFPLVKECKIKQVTK